MLTVADTFRNLPYITLLLLSHRITGDMSVSRSQGKMSAFDCGMSGDYI